MAPLIYPEPTWSNRFGRVVRTLQVVAVAGAIGAVGGGVAVMALVGGGSSSRQPTALKVSTADNAKLDAADNGASRPVGAAPAALQPAAATGAAQVAPAAAAAAETGPQQQQSPAAAAIAETGKQQQSPAAAEPSSNEAATAQHPAEQAAAPANSAADTHLYNRVEPEQKSVPAQAPRARAKVTRRVKNTEHSRRERGVPYPAETSRYSDEHGARYSDERGRDSDQRGGPYSGERYSYRDYDPQPVVRAPAPAPRGYYFGGGGGVFYDRGGWGD